MRITTNGAVPIRESTVKIFSKISIPHYIFVSNYEGKSQYSEQIASLCEKYGVRCTVSPLDNNSNWADLGTPNVNHGYTVDELKSLYKECGMANICAQLIDGQFYSCGRVPALIREGFVPYDEKAFVDMRATPADKLGDKLRKFIFDTKYLDACQNCLGQVPDSPTLKRGVNK
jgi:hypothetical protein